MMLAIACFLFAKFVVVFPENIEILTCPPPNVPKWGDYSPKLEMYYSGDVILYHCDVRTHIADIHLRFCMDNGSWVGEAPFCDLPATFKATEQTSTEEPEEDNGANLASDGNRESCSSTKRGNGESPTWTATLMQPSQVLRVLLFLPIGQGDIEVLTERNDGSLFSCGISEITIDIYQWRYHDCLPPNNTNIVAIKIKSLNSNALQLCEVVTHVFKEPTCSDPGIKVPNGHLQLTRNSYELVCDTGYRSSNNAKVECMRNGEWEKKNLYCEEKPEASEIITALIIATATVSSFLVVCCLAAFVYFIVRKRKTKPDETTVAAPDDAEYSTIPYEYPYTGSYISPKEISSFPSSLSTEARYSGTSYMIPQDQYHPMSSRV